MTAVRWLMRRCRDGGRPAWPPAPTAPDAPMRAEQWEPAGSIEFGFSTRAGAIQSGAFWARVCAGDLECGEFGFCVDLDSPFLAARGGCRGGCPGGCPGWLPGRVATCLRVDLDGSVRGGGQNVR